MHRNRRNERDGLDRLLRSSRPVASERFVESVSAIVRNSLPQRFRLAPRRAFALVFTLAMLGALASFGGISYAASALVGATHAVTRVASPHPVIRPALTPAQAQYGRPGKPPKPPKCKKGDKRKRCHKGHGGVKGASKTIISGGVKGADKTIISGSGVSSGSDLPFTGFDLTLVIGGGLLLVLVGGGLRRFSGSRQ